MMFLPLLFAAQVVSSTIAILDSHTGQSNGNGTAGVGPLSIAQPYSNLLWTNTALVTLVEPSQTAGNESHLSGEANQLTFLGGHTVVTDGWAQSGKSCAEISKGTIYYASGLLELKEMRNAWILAHPGESYVIGPLTVILGEQDDVLGTTPTAYAACLTQLQIDWETDARALLGLTQAQPISLIVVQNGNWTKLASPHADSAGAAIGAWYAARSNPKIMLSHPTYAITTNTSSPHYTNAGHRENGETASRSLYAWTQGTKREPLEPVSATCEGSIITLTLAGGDTADLAVDTTLEAPKPMLGFDYREDAPVQTVLPVVASIAITGPNEIQAALNRHCTASGRLLYAARAIAKSDAGPTVRGAPGGNIRRVTSTAVAQHDGTTPLYDRLIAFDLPLSSCTSCTESPISAYANSGSARTDNAPVAWFDCGDRKESFGATKWALRYVMRKNGSWPSGASILSRLAPGVNHWSVDTLTGELRLRIATGLSAQATWTSAPSSFAGNTWYCMVHEFDGSAPPASRARTWKDGLEITSAGTLAGVMPAALTAAAHSDFTVGSLAGAGNGANLGEWDIAQVAEWIGYLPTGTEITSLCNGKIPGDPALVSTAPVHNNPLIENGEDRGTGDPAPCREYGAVTYTTAHP